jgi:DNA-binding response OmpR family regulator
VSRRLLVLDDDPTILALLGRYFRGLGWQVEACERALQGLELVESGSFDALICDLHLGPGHGAEGLDVISRVRQEQPETAVLLFTAALTEGVRTAALQAGADDVIPKPTPLGELRDATLRAMRKE